MSDYSTDPTWADVTPIPLDDGTGYYADGDTTASGDSGSFSKPILPLAQITLTKEYAEATSYLRALQMKNEMSERALALTAHIILLSPSHYTVWRYRSNILEALKKDLNEEIAWIDKIAPKLLKNYQIWHHRQVVLSDRKSFPTMPPGEHDFLVKILHLDSKNYHVWVYRHWLVRHFELWDSPREIQDVEFLINDDVQNNSAWNHRWMLKFGPRGTVDSGLPNVTRNTTADAGWGKLEVVDEELVDAEIKYAQEKVVLAPENRSPWAYMRGVLRVSGRPLGDLKQFAQKFVMEELHDDGATKEVQVKSSLALEWLADVFTEEAQAQTVMADAEQKKSDATRMLTLLKEKYDPIRKNYWDYKIHNLNKLIAP
ncbi:CAAX geranylgeranyltransferase alpha subunit [Myotisia sp. PD_48]|nr:CAAX geranylgeranyltransferase alpha subunit [Myotisia sp. PD_48]